MCFGTMLLYQRLIQTSKSGEFCLLVGPVSGNNRIFALVQFNVCVFVGGGGR